MFKYGATAGCPARDCVLKEKSSPLRLGELQLLTKATEQHSESTDSRGRGMRETSKDSLQDNAKERHVFYIKKYGCRARITEAMSKDESSQAGFDAHADQRRANVNVGRVSPQVVDIGEKDVTAKEAVEFRTNPRAR